MILRCVVSFLKKVFKIPELSLTPCILTYSAGQGRAHLSRLQSEYYLSLFLLGERSRETSVGRYCI
jgi:hypothetical protein